MAVSEWALINLSICKLETSWEFVIPRNIIIFLFQNSPATRRRRISVKSSAVRKQSARATTPRQRRKTVSTYTPSSPNHYDSHESHISSGVTPSRRLSVSFVLYFKFFFSKDRQFWPLNKLRLVRVGVKFPSECLETCLV